MLISMRAVLCGYTVCIEHTLKLEILLTTLTIKLPFINYPKIHPFVVLFYARAAL
jgi:hypothetical protein